MALAEPVTTDAIGHVDAADPDWADIPARDWQGGAIDCAACTHRALREAARCEPGRSCMQDVYARRIDRFFRTHPALAVLHLGHPYFEVRAIAARFVDVFHLPSLLDDPDETVRMQLALRLPQRQLALLATDPHREVRIRVAQRIEEPGLLGMAGDADYEVRKTVARRIATRHLPVLMQDADPTVRCEVARRLPMPALWRMASDPQPEVRRIVAERLPAPLLAPLVGDLDWLVRWQAAGRALHPALDRLLADEEADVRERAAARAAELDGGRGALRLADARETGHG